MFKKAFWLGLLGLVLMGCGRNEPISTAPNTLPLATNNLQVATGQRVFVPAYAEIFHSNGNRTLPLTVTLAIHNTDDSHPIIIRSVRYYGTDGTLIREFIEQAVVLSPLATTPFVVAENRGGFGANFLVEWVAEEPVFEPVIEAVMVNTESQQGISLVSLGRVLATLEAPTNAEN